MSGGVPVEIRITPRAGVLKQKGNFPDRTAQLFHPSNLLEAIPFQNTINN
jgi:hypothetical protein